MKRLLYRLVIFFLAGTCGTLPAADQTQEFWLQRWGITSARSPIAYHAGTNQLFATHSGRVVLWDVPSGLALREYSPAGTVSSKIQSLVLSSDGQRLLLGTSSSLQLLEVASGEAVRTFDLLDDSLRDVELSTDGTLIAAACSDGRIRIWSADTGDAVNVLDARREVNSVRISPDNRMLISGGDDGVAILWDLETGNIRHRLRAPTEIRSTSFDSSGARVLTLGNGQYWYTPRVVVWDVASGLPVQTIPRTAMDAWFEEDQIALVLPDGSREHWPLDRHETAPAPEDAPTYRYRRDQRWLVAKNHWTLHVEDKPGHATLHPPAASESPIRFADATARYDCMAQVPLDFSSDGRWLLTGSERGRDGGRCVVWDLQAGRMQQTLITGVQGTFDPDARRVIVGQGRELTLFDLHSGEVLGTFKSDLGNFESVQFTHGGTRLLTAVGDWYDGDKGALWLWDTQTGERLRNYAETEKAVIEARMSRDERFIVATLTRGDAGSAGIDQISVIDADSGELVRSQAFEHFGFYALLADPTGKLIVGKRHQQGVYLYQVSDLTQKHHFPGKPGAISPDGDVLAVFESDEWIGYRDTRSGNRLAGQRTRLRQLSSRFHPGAAMYAGKTDTSLNHLPPVGPSVGLESILTGKLEAELYAFDGGEDWLITTADGAINGSPGGLQRVTWRQPGTINVQRQPEQTESIRRAEDVGKVLSNKLPPGTSLSDVLAELPEVSPPAPASEVEPYRPWFKEYRSLREQTVEALRKAGAKLEINIHGDALMIHLEKRRVSDDLLQQLRWVASVDRLYLADTGISDDQLVWVALMPNLKRLSLWSNPITDDGLAKLSGLWNLEVLDVHDTPITAEGLNSLRLLGNLKKLIVPDAIDRDDLKPLAQITGLEIIFRESKSN